MNMRTCWMLGVLVAGGVCCASVGAAGAEIETGTDAKYVEVPLSGTFGEEIYPLGVINVLKKAEEDGVTHVVFRVKSGGGQVWAARAIAEAMKERADKFKYIAVIEDALSATLWPTMNCDELIMTPTARIGAAVVFTKEKSTGAAEVDSKMNSALAAEVAGAAESKGRSALLVRAMMLPEVQVFDITHADGTHELVDTRPGRIERDAKISTLSDAVGVLTLTGKEAAVYDFAKVQSGLDAESIRKAIGVKSWESDGDYGPKEMQDAAKKCDQLRTKAERVAQEAVEAFQQYREELPERYKYTVTGADKKFTKEGKASWQEHTDKAMAGLVKYRNKLKALQDMGQKEGKAAAMGEFFDVERGPKEMLRTLDAVDHELKRLRSGRDRAKLD